MAKDATDPTIQVQKLMEPNQDMCSGVVRCVKSNQLIT